MIIRRHGWRLKGALSGVAFVLGACLPAAASAQAAAATAIQNIAEMQYSLDGVAVSGVSNAARFRVEELLDVAASTARPALSLGGSTAGAIAFAVTNRGNGREAFALDGAVSDGRIADFAIDIDGDGLFDAAIDRVLGTEARTPELAPGAQLAMLALVEDVSLAGATMRVDARAVTASGTPGSTVAGGGDDGVDAIVGSTTASATLNFTLVPGDAAEATLDKAQSVWTSNGPSMSARGATVTYTLTARFTRGTARNAVVADPIPAGTRYLPGTLSIDGITTTDAADGDAGTFTGDAIRAALGTVAGPATRTIQFQVTIQ